ncbi:MAG: transcriptional regulator NrdR [Candidatus Magasanikbacteria bacterium CG11_big_fil_rev_8_21_14_0_20_39_34]|uniref:Transcriptional repressor NrdR n=1 Tax=Candidatus Magasanikbacteria bacterium CG11_big_fil_rev_8_21_14_0_20_39_34 TaxID=1974653 RepID=A0A2H0N4S8_9BACT|nr:MAG: transcriptional regulator NrdR [Candidatus Magasanikbacteria bacterium CG11_big_fil_rev_8_21_14_0_20_39_34]
MYCPVCTCKTTRVVDSRLAPDGMTIRRRRECEKCSYRFSTNEYSEVPDLTVVKNDGKKESYSREKLQKGILMSLAKRPYTLEQFEKLIHSIECDIQKLRKKEINSNEIGEIVMKRLLVFDKVAYIRFASIYRAFEDVNKFQKEIRSLKPTKKKK